VIAARYLARPQPRRLAIFGAGVQGRSHARQFAQAHDLQEIRIVDPFAAAETAAQLEAECQVTVRMTDAADALRDADIVVTASRSTEPLFAGAQLPAGCFVAAIGSSLPHTRELDDAALERASRIVVDWGPQTLRESGDLMRAAPHCLPAGKVIDFAELVTGRKPGRGSADEITVYKAVGVGLQDVALAGLAYERIAAGR
jgi:ornithine cyclodeaminase